MDERRDSSGSWLAGIPRPGRRVAGVGNSPHSVTTTGCGAGTWMRGRRSENSHLRSAGSSALFARALGEARVRPRRQGRWVKRRRPQGQQCERATPGRSVTSATVVIVAMVYPFQSIRHNGERRATRATLTSRLPFVRPSPRCPHTCGIAPGALGVPGDREASSSDPMVASLCSSTKDPARRSPWRRAGCLTQSRRHGPVRSARKR